MQLVGDGNDATQLLYFHKVEVHDFGNNPDVKRITDEIWTSGGVVVAAICQGTAAPIGRTAS